MGAYGQAAIREFLFGSVTKRLLADAELPIFIDH
jgi:nucleotide-binding universal stress UspA family protein